MVEGDAPRLVRHVEEPLGFHVAARGVVEHHEAVFDVVVHREQFVVDGIDRDARHEADAGFRPHDLLDGALRGPGPGAARRARIQEQALAVRIAHQHTVADRVDEHAVEARIRVHDHPHRRQVGRCIDGGGQPRRLRGGGVLPLRRLRLCAPIVCVAQHADVLAGRCRVRLRHEHLLHRRSAAVRGGQQEDAAGEGTRDDERPRRQNVIFAPNWN